MILSDSAIKAAISDKRLIIDPEPPRQNYNTTAIDLRLGKIAKVWMKVARATKLVLDYDDVKLPELSTYSRDAQLETDGSFTIEPDQFVLAQTLERVGLPLSGKLAARVEGRSSLARLGIVIHLTAPTIHADFGGENGAPITLEIINLGPFHVRVIPGVSRICQLIVEKVEGDHGGAPSSQFREQRSPLG
ncbi:dCTP deaminase [Nitrospira sp. Nam80]